MIFRVAESTQDLEYADELEARDFEHAAEIYAQDDVDGDMDGVYWGDGRNLYVQRGDDGKVMKVNVAASAHLNASELEEVYLKPTSNVPIVFLDIDGVMNNWTDLDARYNNGLSAIEWNHESFCKTSVAALATILEKSGAKIVLSSTWRKYHSNQEIEAMLEMNGLRCEIIDRTPCKMSYWSRGLEIACWLEIHPEVTKYVVLDDDPAVLDSKVAGNAWVKIDEFVGLQREHIKDALKFLGVEYDEAQ